MCHEWNVEALLQAQHHGHAQSCLKAPCRCKSKVLHIWEHHSDLWCLMHSLFIWYATTTWELLPLDLDVKDLTMVNSLAHALGNVHYVWIQWWGTPSRIHTQWLNHLHFEQAYRKQVIFWAGLWPPLWAGLWVASCWPHLALTWPNSTNWATKTW